MWDSIRQRLVEASQKIQIKVINGSAKDALDYWDHSEGLSAIAIGGDKLSRGLTLEGLSVSYFLRASRMYDTLLQMGRWFGYRPGYVDLCRLYTTDELREFLQPHHHGDRGIASGVRPDGGQGDDARRFRSQGSGVIRQGWPLPPRTRCGTGPG